MSWLSQLIHPTNPADQAMPYLEQIPGELHGQLDPYANAGQDALGQLKPQYEQLLSDPAAFVNALMAGYEPSAGYQAQKEEMLGEAANTAAAGGFRGTESDIYNQADIINKLMSQDQQQYLQNVLGVYGTGLQGEQGLYDKGFNAANALAGGLANNLASQGSLAFQGQRQQNQNTQDLFKGLTGLASSLAGAFF